MGAGHGNGIHGVEDDGCGKGCWSRGWDLWDGMGWDGCQQWDASHEDFMGRKQQIPTFIHTSHSTTPPGDTGTPNRPQSELPLPQFEPTPEPPKPPLMCRDLLLPGRSEPAPPPLALPSSLDWI